MWPRIRPNGLPRVSRPRRARSTPIKLKTRRKSRSGRRRSSPPAPPACRSPARHARPPSPPCRRSKPTVPTTGASGSSSGTICAPSIGPPSSPACGQPSPRWPPPAANATNAPLSKGPGNRALFYLDNDAIDLAVAAQDVHAVEALQIQPFEAATQLIVLPPVGGGGNGPGGRGVRCREEMGGRVEDEGARRSAVATGAPDELGTSHPFDVGRVDHGQGARRESGIEPLVKPVEGGIGRLLVALVAGERATQLI